MSDFDPRANEPVPMTPAYTSEPVRPHHHVREAAFAPLDVAAFIVTLVMVCGPLAFGAFHL